MIKTNWVLNIAILGLGFFLAITVNKTFANDDRITVVETQVKDFNRRFDYLDKRLEMMDIKFTKLDDKINDLGSKLSYIEQLIKRK